MNATLPASTIVVDANLAVWALLPVLSGVDVVERLVRWRRQEMRLVAPMLWLAECVSAIRRSVHARVISTEEGRAAVEDLLALEVEALPITAQLCRSAFAWAERLGQARAYDGFYLALAEELRAPFWTADKRLVNAAEQAGATWVHWVGATT